MLKVDTSTTLRITVPLLDIRAEPVKVMAVTREATAVSKVMLVKANKATVAAVNKVMAAVSREEAMAVVSKEVNRAVVPNVSSSPPSSPSIVKLKTSLALVNEDEVVNHAEQNGSGDRSMFSSALGFLGSHSVRHQHCSPLHRN